LLTRFLFLEPFLFFSLSKQALIFAPRKFFSFSRGAKFGEFRPASLAQVVCASAVRE
jgi:hypothetical protein